jgi:transcriptional regulator with XRE-family HTH domain
VARNWTIGDVIRKERVERGWNQERLGREAEKYALRESDVAINKNTVSKVENEPYSSELGTVWRLLAALSLTFAEVEQRIDPPFIETKETGTAHADRPEFPRITAADRKRERLAAAKEDRRLKARR